MKKTIVLTGGGTLGHCAPHFAIIPYLKDFNIVYIGSKNGIEKNAVISKKIPYYSISTVKFERDKKLKNLSIPCKLLKSVRESKKLLKQIKPAVIFSKGGYVGLPVTIAGKKLGIPVIVHESDYSLGLANKIASKFSSLTLVTFKDTLKSVKNGEYVGFPINEELYSISRQDSLKYYGFKDNRKTLLITGGSLGAKIINENVYKILDKLVKTFNVLHLVGKNNLSGIQLENYVELEFTDMKYAYACCDMAISRAGANTLFELIVNKTPTILIPLQNGASRGDQLENANYFLKDNLVRVLSQENLNENTLYNEIIVMSESLNKYKNRLLLKNITPANQKIAKILNKY